MIPNLINWPTNRHGVILIDPPWDYRVWSERGNGRNASQHYPVQPIDWIASLPVADIAEQTCILFCWVTWPNLAEGLAAINAWGFTYKTCGFSWVKLNRESGGAFFGNGYYTRANNEACLLATRGPGPFRPAHLGVSQVVTTEEPAAAFQLPWYLAEPETIQAAVGAHSRKPPAVQERIEQLYPDATRVELFARQPRPGWWSWGNEIPGYLVYTDPVVVPPAGRQLSLFNGQDAPG